MNDIHLMQIWLTNPNPNPNPNPINHQSQSNWIETDRPFHLQSQKPIDRSSIDRIELSDRQVTVWVYHGVQIQSPTTTYPYDPHMHPNKNQSANQNTISNQFIRYFLYLNDNEEKRTRNSTTFGCLRLLQEPINSPDQIKSRSIVWSVSQKHSKHSE